MLRTVAIDAPDAASVMLGTAMRITGGAVRCVQWSVSSVRASLQMLTLAALVLITLPTVTHAQPGGIRIQSVLVPKLVFVGQDATLECRFTWTRPSELYSVKWWRNNDQFYQYIPRNNPQKMPFQVKGINVDPMGYLEVERLTVVQARPEEERNQNRVHYIKNMESSEFTVKLREVTLDTAGVFTCEVMADDSFETHREAAEMIVIDPPDNNEYGELGGPTIEVEGVRIKQLEYHRGDVISADCLSRCAYPNPTLTWYINDRKASEDLTGKTTVWNDCVDSRTSNRTIKLRPQSHMWDDDARITLKCRVQIEDVYDESTVLEVFSYERRLAKNSGLFAHGATVHAPWWLVTLSLLTPLLQCFLQVVPLHLNTIL